MANSVAKKKNNNLFSNTTKEYLLKTKISITNLNDLKDRKPTYALVSSTDLVVVKYDENISVFYGRCLHRGALMADGFVDGHNLICGVHN